MSKIFQKILLFSEKRVKWNVCNLIVCFIFSFFLCTFKIKLNLDNLDIISNLALAFFGINGAFMTFFITLDKSHIFNALKSRYNHLYGNLLNKFKNNMIFSVLLNIVVFMILMFKNYYNLYLNFIFIIVFLYLFIEVVLGFLYLLDITNSLLTRNEEKESVKK